MITQWEEEVREGARLQTLHRLQFHSRAATAARKTRLIQEFQSAMIEREKQFSENQIKMRERWRNRKEYDKKLTLEEYGRLYVINLGTWAAFVFWRTVRGKRVFNWEET